MPRAQALADKRAPMIPSASSASISDRREAELPRTAVVLTEQRGGRCVQPPRAPREPHRAACCSGKAPTPDGRPLRRIGGPELSQLGLAVRLHDLADRHTGCPQSSTIRRPAGRGTTPPGLHRGARAPGPPPGRPGRDRRPPRRPTTRHNDDHCSSVATAIATQESSRPCSSGPATCRDLRRRAGATVTGSAEQGAVGRELDHLLRSDIRARHRPSRPRPGRPSPVRSRCSSASSRPKSACSPHWGHRRVRLEGKQVGMPVNQVSPRHPR